jgi:hypothetical protein
VVEGARSRSEALARYGAFAASHRWKYEAMLQVQHLVPRLRPRVLTGVVDAFERAGVSHWAFRHYLEIAPPSFALPAPAAAARSLASSVVAA